MFAGPWFLSFRPPAPAHTRGRLPAAGRQLRKSRDEKDFFPPFLSCIFNSIRITRFLRLAFKQLLTLPAELLSTEQELLQRVANSDGHAFEQLFKKYWPQVYGTGLHLTRSPEQAKDLAQDIFLKLWNNRSKLTEVKRTDAFLYTLSRNHIIDHLRKKVFHTSNIDFLINYFRDDAVLRQEHLECEELENAIHTAITTMPGKVQDVFRLSRFEGLTHEQIAARLNISVVSSKTYIVRALQHLRTRLLYLQDKAVLLIILALSRL